MCAVILVGLSFSKVKIPSGVNVPSASVNGTGWIVEVNFRLFSLETDLCKEQFWLSSIKLLKWYSLCRFLSISGDLHVIRGVTALNESQ